MRSQSRRGCRFLIVLMPVLLLASCTGRSSRQANLLFEQMIGPIFDGTLRVDVGQQRYAQGDWVDMWLENKTGVTLYFPDQSFGVEGFQYNQSTGQWESYSLGGGVGNPVRKKLEPDALPELYGYYTFPTDHMKIDHAKSVRIRLLVIGYSQPLEVGGGQRHGVYADIVVTAH